MESVTKILLNSTERNFSLNPFEGHDGWPSGQPPYAPHDGGKTAGQGLFPNGVFSPSNGHTTWCAQKGERS